MNNIQEGELIISKILNNYISETNNYYKILESVNILKENNIILELDTSTIKSKIIDKWEAFKAALYKFWNKIKEIISNIISKISSYLDQNNSISKEDLKKVDQTLKDHNIQIELKESSRYDVDGLEYEIKDYSKELKKFKTLRYFSRAIVDTYNNTGDLEKILKPAGKKIIEYERDIVRNPIFPSLDFDKFLNEDFLIVKIVDIEELDISNISPSNYYNICERELDKLRKDLSFIKTFVDEYILYYVKSLTPDKIVSEEKINKSVPTIEIINTKVTKKISSTTTTIIQTINNIEHNFKDVKNLIEKIKKLYVAK